MGIKNDEKTINSKFQLIEYFESQCKLKSDFKIGTEHEKFLFYENSLMPLNQTMNLAKLEKVLKNSK